MAEKKAWPRQLPPTALEVAELLALMMHTTDRTRVPLRDDDDLGDFLGAAADDEDPAAKDARAFLGLLLAAEDPETDVESREGWWRVTNSLATLVRLETDAERQQAAGRLVESFNGFRGLAAANPDDFEHWALAPSVVLPVAAALELGRRLRGGDALVMLESLGSFEYGRRQAATQSRGG